MRNDAACGAAIGSWRAVGQERDAMHRSLRRMGVLFVTACARVTQASPRTSALSTRSSSGHGPEPSV
eukprot:7377806-Prymnesium_polylepis.2